ncbi:MAG: adenosylcobalamin-dependent ribonucleoside-diphosphate reductase [Balneolaceae bacterium]|nr:adenosylcobalamin-dependent ribonucleoside-diphosphate reductase [Balneolaceae bacterium]
MNRQKAYFETEISRRIWDTKYRADHEDTVVDSWKRIARAIASVEPKNRNDWEQRFFGILEDFNFLPGGRIQHGAGTDYKVTLFNCFVMGTIKDSIPSIFENLKEGALTMQQGGGVGYDFSTLRPRGTAARTTNNISSGPVSFMRIWDTMCGTMLSTGGRRGAMMATLRCDHPDIIEFVRAKQESGQLTNFNLSVLATDEFLDAVTSDKEWPLVFPIKNLRTGQQHHDQIIQRLWSGTDQAVPCKVFDTIDARELWNAIMEATYEYAEPGMLFIDRINRWNNLGYAEQINSTNPCGEVPLPPYGACNLGSVNLTRFVDNPFEDHASLDLEEIVKTVRTAVRFLDNVIDFSKLPLPQQEERVRQTRRIGIGITGLADTLIMLGQQYGSREGRKTASEVMKRICHTAYATSVELAREKGGFPLYHDEKFPERPFIRSLPDTIQKKIKKHGIRNSHLLSIAPTGSISILANNISSGLEPVYDFSYSRQVLNADGSTETFEVEDYVYRKWKELKGDQKLPGTFVTAKELSPKCHLQMQAALQAYVDQSISKTINIPADYPFEDFKDIYNMAYDEGLKGCTTYRPNPTTGAVLESSGQEEVEVHCCTVDREGD